MAKQQQRQKWVDLVVKDGGARINGKTYEGGDIIGATQVTADEAWLINQGLVETQERTEPPESGD